MSNQDILQELKKMNEKIDQLIAQRDDATGSGQRTGFISIQPDTTSFNDKMIQIKMDRRKRAFKNS